MKPQKGLSVRRTEHTTPMGQGPSTLLGQSKELLNIPISISLLHEREYNNVVRHLHNEKRRSVSEKNKSNAPIRFYHTEVV
jgi:hypothetical protein